MIDIRSSGGVAWERELGAIQSSSSSRIRTCTAPWKTADPAARMSYSYFLIATHYYSSIFSRDKA